ncbi:hypothetical protein ElyMa_004751700 [Elysia marginata]|uniref:Uncharacterized protein n=1 Tax=Elysia marginata TaxID=1093978 RepID=A0AAV4IGP7_9GAST|nr:hypothetical protein ElyMa_004751700 [Elysia marginata]
MADTWLFKMTTKNIMKKPLSQTPRRLQNLPMRPHCYDCEFQYLQGPNLLIADTLSRAVGTDSSNQIPDLQINFISAIPDPMLMTTKPFRSSSGTSLMDGPHPSRQYLQA